MYWDREVTIEDEEELIEKIARAIHKYGMEAAAILWLETVKPLAYIGGQMGRFFVSPFLPAFGESIGWGGEKFFRIFEKKENVEKLITLLEKIAQEEDKKPKEEPEKPAEDEAESDEKPQKRGWRRFIPF